MGCPIKGFHRRNQEQNSTAFCSIQIWPISMALLSSPLVNNLKAKFSCKTWGPKICKVTSKQPSILMQIEFSVKINESETDIQYAARFPQTENRTAIKMPRSDKAAITREILCISWKKVVTVNEWVFLCCIFPPSFLFFVCLFHFPWLLNRNMSAKMMD